MTGDPEATVDVETLRHLFDLAVDTPLVCSGSFDTDDVNVLRRVAALIGVDPEKITPDEFVTQYPHTFRPRTVNRDRGQRWGYRTIDGEILDEYRPDARSFFRPETDAEYAARLDGELADLGCQAGTHGRQCGRPADDERHRKDTPTVGAAPAKRHPCPSCGTVTGPYPETHLCSGYGQASPPPPLPPPARERLR